MLGYELKDLDDMIYSVRSILTVVDSNDDPWLHNNLAKTLDFLQGLWAEGYFD